MVAGTRPADMKAPVLKADPCGLIRSFVCSPPAGQITPNDVFVIWMLSHRQKSTIEAARAVIGAYGAAMARSGSNWLAALLKLFTDVAGPPATPPAGKLGQVAGR